MHRAIANALNKRIPTDAEVDRRQVMLGGGAVALSGSVALTGPEPLLAMEAEWRAAEDAANAGSDTIAADDLAERIASQPTQTLDGVAVKLRQIKYMSDDGFPIDSKLADTALEALERILGQA